MISLRRPRFARALCFADAAPAAMLCHDGMLLTLASGQDAPIERGYLLVSDYGRIAALGTGDGANDPAVTTGSGPSP